MGILSRLFDFSTPDFDGINAKLDRLNEIEDDLDTDDMKVGRELLTEKWQIYEELKGKIVTVDVVEEEEDARPWWKVW